MSVITIEASLLTSITSNIVLIQEKNRGIIIPTVIPILPCSISSKISTIYASLKIIIHQPPRRKGEDCITYFRSVRNTNFPSVGNSILNPAYRNNYSSTADSGVACAANIRSYGNRVIHQVTLIINQIKA